MRVGNILLEHGWVDPPRLERALAEQRRTGMRLCSILVAQGALTFDHAACALGEHHGVAAALQRHLQGRDRSVEALLPGGLARSAVALPIGRMGDGTLIVCVRDPSPSLHDVLARALGETIVLAVTPARWLEQLVERAHPRPAPELDIDIDVDLGTDGSVEIDLEGEAPSPDDPFELDISVEVARPRTAPRPMLATLPVSIEPVDPVSATSSPPARGTLEGTVATLADIDELDWLFDVVMAYVATRWTASLLLAITEGAAVGRRGHDAHLGEAAIRSIAVPLAESSIVRLAQERRRVVSELPADAGAVQDQLATLLGAPEHPVAVAITSGAEVAYVLVVGDPRSDDPDDAAVDLARLADAIEETLARIGPDGTA